MLNIINIILFIIIYNYSVNSELITQNLNKENKIVEYATKFYFQETTNIKTTLLFYSDEILINLFLKQVEKQPNSLFLTISIKNCTTALNEYKTNVRPDIIIFFLDDNTNDISSIIFEVETLQIWNPRAKHLFIFPNVGKNYKDWVKNSFVSLWQNQVLRSLIMFPYNDKMKLFTYNPFLKQFSKDISEFENGFYIEKITNMCGAPIKFYYFNVQQGSTRISIENDNGKIFYSGEDGLYMGKYFVQFFKHILFFSHNCIENIVNIQLSTDLGP